jgi:hypothetical protein
VSYHFPLPTRLPSISPSSYCLPRPAKFLQTLGLSSEYKWSCQQQRQQQPFEVCPAARVLLLPHQLGRSANNEEDGGRTMTDDKQRRMDDEGRRLGTENPRIWREKRESVKNRVVSHQGSLRPRRQRNPNFRTSSEPLRSRNSSKKRNEKVEDCSALSQLTNQIS